ncbi:hypothetical protein Nepgr_032457 [Nepenthes gracilis]|uniref:RING-type E3 ubiquitin transferase n=1 Tax=Nepenthes gracilis TaxID=150966 RepID=A0AAD3Y7W7_NEPGR|nr:hypothetical protein Nepgr_032457 [Nepenthes gracilis]
MAREELFPESEWISASRRSRVTSPIRQPAEDQAGEEASNEISVILSDPKFLDCPGCLEPLTIPVFQCGDGHVACSACSTKFKNKCPSCTKKIGHNRCQAVEKVIESVKIRCCYVNYGCKEVVSYSKKQFHEKLCTYAPLGCPFAKCNFCYTSTMMSKHISLEHGDFVVRFRYNSIFPVSIHSGDKFLVLLEKSDGVVFLLQISNSVFATNSSLIVKCLELSPEKGKFAYDLVMRSGINSLKFNSFTLCANGQVGVPPRTDFVPIPDYFRCSSNLKVELCIWNKEASSMDKSKGI